MELSGATTWLLSAGKIFIIAIIIILFLAMFTGVMYFIMDRKRYSKYRAFVYKRYVFREGKRVNLADPANANIDTTNLEQHIVFCGWDKAAYIKRRKLKRWAFHLKKANVDLGMEEREDMDEDRELDVPTMPSETGNNIVFVEKLGPRKYALGRPYLFEGHVKIIISAADCADAINTYDLNAKTYGKQNTWIGPLAFAVFAVLIIVLIAVVLNKFEVLKGVSDNLLKIAEYQRGAGPIIAQ
jgi:hypothetical protein